MSVSLHNPHDKFFRSAMSDKRVAGDFFQHHLPVGIKSLINFDSLQFCKESFVEEQLKMSSADVLYQVQINQSDAYLYVLVEHQSTVDKWIALRLWNYMLRIFEHHRNQYGGDTLPVIYPLVFYNGKKKYKKSTDFFDLFGDHRKLAFKIYTEPFRLIDVQKISDEELRRYLWAGVLEFVFKHRYAGDFLIFAEEVMRWLHVLESQDGFDYVKVVIKYVLSGTDGSQEQQLIEIAQHVSPELGEEAMTFAERFEQRGYEKGKTEGMQRGLQQGVMQVAKNLLKRGLALQTIAEATGLSLVQIEKLRQTEQA